MSLIASPAGEQQRVGAALAASLVIHAAGLALSLPAPRLAAFEVPAPLRVRLVEPPPPPAPVAPKPKAVKKPEVVKVPEVVEAPKRVEAPKPEAEPQEAPPPVAAPDPQPLAPAITPPLPQVAVATPIPPAPQPSAAELLASYAKTISQTLARYKEYPRIAQMRGWQGAVTLELRVAPSGRLLGAELHTSSGYPMLDEQALEMAARAKQFPAPPERIRESEIAVLVPVVFRLTP